MKRVLTLISIAEFMTGVLLFFVPGVISGVLLGSDVVGTDVIFARLAGIALIGLGMACWPGPQALGMLIYSILAGLYLAWLGITQIASGPLLWPAVIVHVIMAVPLATHIKYQKSPDV
ncbi:hypothetical protein [Gemmobacter aquatilis]|uniref:hypothetical protein n=1 Tax=Gemmobacter aquatilis TaxID=933059 RepID=UPI000B85E9E1|nr:hypothetical protein [Gemmobacter aquatilis]